MTPESDAAALSPSPFAALRYRDFRLLWVGQLISGAGTEMQRVAINWHIYLLTGSALALGLSGLVRFLPRRGLMISGSTSRIVRPQKRP